MPEFNWKAFQDETAEIILLALPEVTAIWKLDQAIRESWEKRTPPYVTYELSPTSPGDEWGATLAAYLWDVSVHYVAHEAFEVGGLVGQDAVSQRLEVLKARLLIANMGILGWPVSRVTLRMPPYPDTSRQNELNAIFYGKNIPFVAGTLTCPFVGGTSAV